MFRQFFCSAYVENLNLGIFFKHLVRKQIKEIALQYNFACLTIAITVLIILPGQEFQKENVKTMADCLSNPGHWYLVQWPPTQGVPTCQQRILIKFRTQGKMSPS